MKDLTNRGKKSKRTEIQLANLNVEKSLSTGSQDIFQSAALGCIVTFNLLEQDTNESEVHILKLVDQKSGEFEISLNSPIGKKIIDTHVDDVIPFELNNTKFTITILKIETPWQL